MGSKIRVSFDLTPEGKRMLDDLQQKAQANTLTELFRKGMALYSLFLEHQNAKGRVILENADGTREVLRVL